MESNASKLFFDELDDFIGNPRMVGRGTPEEWYLYFEQNGYSPLPLSDGRWAHVSFLDGGGFKLNWGGDRILQYHPAGPNHHGGKAYWKVGSGKTGLMWFDLQGNWIKGKNKPKG